MNELTPFPYSQYKLLEEFIAERSSGKIIENELLILNIKLLCKLGFKKEV